MTQKIDHSGDNDCLIFFGQIIALLNSALQCLMFQLFLLMLYINSLVVKTKKAVIEEELETLDETDNLTTYASFRKPLVRQIWSKQGQQRIIKSKCAADLSILQTLNCATTPPPQYRQVRFLHGTVCFSNALVRFIHGTFRFLHGMVLFLNCTLFEWQVCFLHCTFRFLHNL